MADWGYDTHNGPDTWPSKYPDAGGKKQSPVDIVTSSVLPKEFDQPLRWKYGSENSTSIVNTGCGWRVDVHGSDSELCGGPLLHTYELVQFHCHWGSSYSCGSEHTIDGKSYAGELHFVHWNKETFPTCADAIPSAEGLSVVAVFLQEGEMNSEIEKLCEVIPSILEKDQRVNLENDINPESLFPSEHSYWTYSGSLTTPPCYESVTWIIFKNPITVSAEQLNCFRQMKNARCDVNSESSGLVEHNYRPPQSLNDRVIFESVC
ncbi:carbonic anhydrase 1-like isoform X2 [Stegodyphus dumicola]|uniref:carbonic anhydrase 1-like isoform X2 n=1 Tax=Stegodyphus dumicola TaxID=202533 RepID=UPI0015AC8706|nr:carbonic anhydrase 1-like isoform X2 [Stegodyphus dumicola]